MREIIFRGKHAQNNEWVFGYFYLDYPHNNPRIIDGDSTFYVIPETVSQYTGLKDRNGKQIFYGDIVKDQFGNIGVVKYSDHFLDWRIRFYIGRDDLTAAKDWGVRIFDWVYPKMCLEIIGNIYDALELLESQNEIR
jgi:uncharacterized phage protein (TIGR01671 family)